MLRSTAITARVVAGALTFVAGAALFTGCATRAMTAPSESSTPTSTATGSPSPDPADTPSSTPTPTPTSTPPDDVPPALENTKVMFITLDEVDGSVEASGMLPNVVEEGGTCSLTLTRGVDTRTVTAGTAVGPESTYCSLLTVPAAQLGNGEWVATLSYRSDAYEGVSATETVQVP